MQKITSILAIALLCLVCLAFADKLNDPKLISAINRDPQGTWRARSYPQFEGKTAAEISHLFGALSPLSPSRFYSHKLFSKGRRDIPESFDSYERWPHYIHPIREQGSCGSWWAFSSSSMLSDRFAITTNGTTNVELSPQYMVSCDKDDQGCEGGDMDSLWKFLSTNGTVSENCSPYVSGSGLVPVCNKYCVDRSKMKFYKADEKSIKYFGPRDLQGIQEDIMQNGPIVTEFKVYLDFVNYASGVYRHESGNALGRLAVKVTGWGVDSASGLPYWIAANSWGTEWGQKGFFWILRGKNECQIEVNFYTALPLLE